MNQAVLTDTSNLKLESSNPRKDNIPDLTEDEGQRSRYDVRRSEKREQISIIVVPSWLQGRGFVLGREGD